MDPSIGIFLPDVLLSNVGQRANTRFTQFGTIGFSDIDLFVVVVHFQQMVLGFETASDLVESVAVQK
jgi:hypothetical protein